MVAMNAKYLILPAIPEEPWSETKDTVSLAAEWLQQQVKKRTKNRQLIKK